jgi:hypothetical protein
MFGDGESDSNRFMKLQLSFLTNKWALWLDKNSKAIEDPESKEREELNSCFDAFKNSCHQSTTGIIKFASTPSELVELGRDLKDYSSSECFRRAIEKEPDHCESALMHEVHRILQTESYEKLKAKELLIKAKSLMQHKIDVLSSCGEIIKIIAKGRRQDDSTTDSDSSKQKQQSRFEEQVKTQYYDLSI